MLGRPAISWHGRPGHVDSTTSGTPVPLSVLQRPVISWHGRLGHVASTTSGTPVPLSVLRRPAILWHGRPGHVASTTGGSPCHSLCSADQQSRGMAVPAMSPQPRAGARATLCVPPASNLVAWPSRPCFLNHERDARATLRAPATSNLVAWPSRPCGFNHGRDPHATLCARPTSNLELPAFASYLLGIRPFLGYGILFRLCGAPLVAVPSPSPNPVPVTGLLSPGALG
jgi:hypothetical protein